MNQKAAVAELIVCLQHAVARPMMHMPKVTADNAISFCIGFSCAYSAVGINSELDFRPQATNSRGWEFTALRGVDEMRSAGLSEEQIVQELLLIEIKMLELVAEGLED